MVARLRFGVPGLDGLFGTAEPNYLGLGFTHEGTLWHPTSLCLSGPEGTGKSVLGLHLATQYAYDSHLAGCWPLIVYASMDLAYDRARIAWARFGLGHPGARAIPFGGHLGLAGHGADATEVQLRRCSPYAAAASAQSMASFLTEACGQPRIAFLDLAAETGGDDWGFLNKLVSALPPPPDGQWPHLMIVDAVEGLEMQVGQVDAFGQRRSRRSRVAQLLRSAHPQSHVVLLCEHGDVDSEVEEAYLCDYSLRLRCTMQREYPRRTAEVTKARGQQHYRGQYDYTMRSGKGSTTGSFPNPDDPIVRHYLHDQPTHPDFPLLSMRGNDPDREVRVQSYVHVYPSLHRSSRLEEDLGIAGQTEAPRSISTTGATASRPDRPPEEYVGFGLRYLDAILGGAPGRASWPNIGFPAGRLIALIGGKGTRRRQLCRAFQSQAFLRIEDENRCADAIEGACVVLTNTLSTVDDELDAMTPYLRGCQTDDFAAYMDSVRSRLIVRSLETSETPPSAFYHTVEQLIASAKSTLPAGKHSPRDLRFVIYDWTVLMETHEGLRNDPFLLPKLEQLFRRQGVSALIVATNEGEPFTRSSDPAVAHLQKVSSYHVYTWYIPFYGERRVAVSAVPSRQGTLATAREVEEFRHFGTNQDGPTARGRVNVNPHFDLYEGIKDGKPSPIPLEVALFQQEDDMAGYDEAMNEVLMRLHVPRTGFEQIVNPFRPAKYDLLRDAVTLLRERRLDHTMVLQIDEFWSTEQKGVLIDLGGYLHQEPVVTRPVQLHAMDENGFYVKEQRRSASQSYADPYGLWDTRTLEGVPDNPDPIDLRVRWAHFNSVVCPETAMRDRVPYSWDFGFLLLKKDAWLAMGHDPSVKAVFEALSDGSPRNTQPPIVSWAEFEEAATKVANAVRLGGGRATAFDLDIATIESLSCFFLEILYSDLYRQGSEIATRIVRDRGQRIEGEGVPSTLHDWLEPPFDATLVESIVRARRFLENTEGTEGAAPYRHLASHDAVAVRHWYSSACRFAGASRRDWIVARLPGHFTVRGDWYLAMPHGCRSRRLGERAFDLLCSVRANAERLERGIGLPARTLGSGYCASARLPLSQSDSAGNSVQMSYDALRAYGASQDLGIQEPAFHWLWRSNIVGYDRCSRSWGSFLVDTLLGDCREMAPEEIVAEMRGRIPSLSPVP